MKSFIVVSCSKTTRAVHQMPNNSMAGMPVPSVAQATIRCAISASGRNRPGETTVMPNAILAFFTLAATLAYLGLAILGWGGFAAFCSHPARIALAVVTFALSGAALFTRGNLSPGVREDRANRWVIAVFGVLALLAAYLPAYT